MWRRLWPFKKREPVPYEQIGRWGTFARCQREHIFPVNYWDPSTQKWILPLHCPYCACPHIELVIARRIRRAPDAKHEWRDSKTTYELPEPCKHGESDAKK